MYENGVNFFDTAEVYGKGVAETYMGRAFKELNIPREDIVVSTKMYRSSNDFPTEQFLSRKHIIEGLKNSLAKL